MTATRPQRYDQCDDTCTVDCGHCKGKGRPDPFAGLRDRLLKAEIELEIAVAIEAGRGKEPERLRGKAQGVRLALSYVDEALRTAQPAEEATR